MNRAYLDHNASSPLRPEASAAILAALERHGNASSLHAEGRSARSLVEDARAEVAALAGVEPKRIVLTSGGSEAIASAIGGVVSASERRGRIVVATIEHSAVLEGARLAAKRGAGLAVEEVPCERSGRVDPERFLATLGKDVVLAALQLANNETGVLQPVEPIGEACRRLGVPLLVDAVQAAGKHPLGGALARADLVAISSHKLGGPQGAGALVVRDGARLDPLIPGGAQERRRRGGTEAVAAIAGFGAAAGAARRDVADEGRRLAGIRDRLESRLRERFPGARIHGSDAARLSNTTSFAIPGVQGELLAIALDLEGIAVSTGSACASGAVEPSHVLRAMGYTDAESRETVRVSTGWSTTESDVDRLLYVLPSIVERLRRSVASPVS
jgi:cysteine desulfurase